MYEAQKLAHINRHIAEVKSLFNHFCAAEKDHSVWFSQLLGSESNQGALLSDPIRKCFKGILSVDKASLMFTGANSSGKSTLINALLRRPILPSGSGHVTGRVCKLSHASWEDSCINFLRINKAELSLDPIPELPSISLAPFKNQPREAMLTIKKHLKRPDEQQEEKVDTEELKRWLTTIVEIRLPFEGVVSPELDLYDVPGFSISDSPLVQDFLTEFISTIKPIPVFVYANPTFSNAEIACLKSLVGLLCLSSQDGKECLHEIFFVSTYFDCVSIANDKCICPGQLNWEIIEEERNHRYSLLQNSPKVKSIVDLPKSVDQCYSFACVSAIDYFSDHPMGEKIFTNFVNKLDEFAEKAHLRLLTGVLNGLLRGIKLFFQGVNMHKTHHLEQIRTDLAKAKASISLLKRNMETRVSSISELLSSNIRERARSSELRESAVLAAKATSLSYDGKELALYHREAAGAFTEKFGHWICENVIDYGMNTVREELKKELGEAIADFLSSTRDNLLLEGVIMAEFPIISLDQGQRRFSLMFPRTLSNFIYILMVSSIIGLPFAMAWSWLRKKRMLGDAFGVVDEDFKIRLALDMLEKVEKKFTDMGQERMSKVFEYALGIVNRIKEEVNRRAQNLRRMADAWKVDGAKKELEERVNLFSTIGAHLLAAKTSLTNPEAPTVTKDSRVLGEGATATVYAAQWQGKDVAVKVCRTDARQPPEIANMFFKEIHYAWQLTDKPSPYLLSMLGVYQDDAKGWMIIYPLCRTSLRDLLQTESSKLTVTGALRISLCLARAVHHMHQANIMHRDIKPENILIVEENPLKVVLGDYGAATGASVANTLIGTPGYIAPEALSYAAPEIGNHGLSVYTNAADIYSIGKVLKQLSCRMGLKEHELKPLITNCLSDDPSQRPTAKMIVHVFENLTAQLEDQPSIYNLPADDSLISYSSYSSTV